MFECIRKQQINDQPSGIERFHSRGQPASMQIYRDKRKRPHKKRVQLLEDFLVTPTWPLFHCFGTPIWPP